MSGDCCRAVGEVVMTREEQQAIECAAPSGVALVWLPHDDHRFVRLQAGPCPLLVGNLCGVYAVRPVNCRRWGCGRDDVTTEPLDLADPPARFYRDRDFRRQLVLMGRKAMTQWGQSHGWSQEMQ